MAQKKPELDLQTKDNGGLIGRYRTANNLEFGFSLNNRRTGYYALTGTMSLIDPVTKSVLKIYDSESKTNVPASIPIHVKVPRGYENTDRLVEKEIERAAQVLEEKHAKKYAQAFKNGKLLGEMTLIEARMAYEEEAATKISNKPKQQKEYIDALKKLQTFEGKPLGKLKKKDLIAAVEAATDSVETRGKILSRLQQFIEFVQEKQRIKSEVAQVVEQALKAVKAEIEREHAEKNKTAGAKNANNSDVLSSDAEKELNERCTEKIEDPRYVVIAVAKGSGLAVHEVCSLQMKQCVRMENPEELFLAIERNYVSATHDYTFPMFPFEARLLNSYLDILEKKEGKERLSPERYVFSEDSGITPLKSDEACKICRQELQRLRFGFADLLGNVDLKKDKGVNLLKATYENRLEKYCGVTKERDEGAWMFLRHVSLGKCVQADHYRGFTGESGRRCLLDYVQQDRRFLPPPKRKKKNPTYRTIGDRQEYTVHPTDNENEHQVRLEVELHAGDSMWITAEHGCLVQVVEYEALNV